MRVWVSVWVWGMGVGRGVQGTGIGDACGGGVWVQGRTWGMHLGMGVQGLGVGHECRVLAEVNYKGKTICTLLTEQNGVRTKIT